MRLYSGWGGQPKAFEEEPRGAWAEVARDLREVVDEDQWDAARASTLTAFYTPAAVARAMARTLREMGVGDGFEVLEPGCGTGAFMDALAAEGVAAHVTGVEVDPLSALICEALHPDQTVVRAGLEDCSIAEGSFDAVIGNVPYSDAIRLDFDGATLPIHDYFVREAVRAVRPGGVVCLLTSRYTMDKADEATRRWLCERSELVGMARLPEETFAGAGTSVISDVIVLRRRPQPVLGASAAWVHVGDMGGVRVNRTVLDDRLLAIGDLRVVTGRFGADIALSCARDADWVGGELATRLSADVRSRGLAGCLAVAPERMAEPFCQPRPQGAQEYEYALDDAGRVWYGDDSGLEPVTTRFAGDMARLSAMVSLRDRKMALMELEGTDAPDEEVDGAISSLRDAYRAFVADFGRICDARNQRAWATRRDYSGAQLSSLEVLDASRQFEREADVLTMRVRRPEPKTPDHVDDPADALAISLASRGEVDMELVSGLLGTDEAGALDALGELVVADPDTGRVVTAPEYLSGNVAKKLAHVRGLLASELDGGRAAAVAEWLQGLGMGAAHATDGFVKSNVDGFVRSMSDLGAWGQLLDPDGADTVSPLGACLDACSRYDTVTLALATARILSEGGHPLGLAGEDVPSRMLGGILPVAAGAWGRDKQLCLEVLRELACAPVDMVSDEAVAAFALRGLAVARERTRFGSRFGAGGGVDTSYHLIGPLLSVCTLLGNIDLDSLMGAVRESEGMRLFPHDLDRLFNFDGSISDGRLQPAMELARGVREHPEVLEYVFHCNSMGEAPTPEGLEAFRGRRDEFVSGRSRVADPERVASLRGLEGRLRAALPERLQPEDVSMRLGASWIPVRYVARFAEEALGLPDPTESVASRRKLQVCRLRETGEWSVTAPGDLATMAAQDAYAVKAVKGYSTVVKVTVAQMLTHALNGTCPTLTKVDDAGKSVVDPEATANARLKRNAVVEAWDRWLSENRDVAEELAGIYNDKVNVMVPRTYDGSYLAFPGMSSDIRMREHQKNAVARMLGSEEGTLVAHVVGAGKTFEGIAGIMEARRLGRATKPMVVVPNNLTEQWAADFLRLYPTAKIAYMTAQDTKSADAARAFWARVASGDWDAVVVGHSRFSQLGVSRERKAANLRRRVGELSDSIVNAERLSGRTSFPVKRLERIRARIEKRMEALREDRSIEGTTFEDLGVDYLFVDEAHNFKNLAVDTALDVAGLTNAASSKCEDLLDKCEYLRERGLGRNIVFATGTPVSNTISELYNLQRYLAPRQLDELGVSAFSAWASTFGEIVDSVEVRPEGGFQVKARFARFHNLPELMAAFHNFADIVTSDDIDLDLPEVERVNVQLMPNESQRYEMAGLVARADAIHRRLVKPDKDNMLKVTSDGRKLALDPKLLHLDEAEWPALASGKVAECARRVADVWRETEGVSGTQLVFCDTSTDASGAWNVTSELRDRIVALGVPADQVRTVNSAGDSQAKRQALYDQVNEGRVRVLIGSTQTLGTGVNVQTHLVATHDLDCPWRPADLEQRAGRIVRQGNLNRRVRIFRYVVADTLDAFMYQTCETKQRFVAQVFTNKSPLRDASDIDETAVDLATLKALSTGDPKVAERIKLKGRVDQLTLLRSARAGEVAAMRKRVEQEIAPRVDVAKEELSRYLGQANAFARAREATSAWEGGHAEVTVGGEVLTTRREASIELARAAREAEVSEARRVVGPIGSLCGLDVVVLGKVVEAGRPPLRYLALRAPGAERLFASHHAVPASGGGNSLDNLLAVIDGFEEKMANARARLDAAQAELEATIARCEEPWALQGEYDEACRKLRELGGAPGEELRQQRTESTLDAPEEEESKRPDREPHEEEAPEKGRKVAALWVPCGLGDPVVGLEVPATEETLTRILGERRQVTRMTRLPDGAEVLAVMGLDGLPVSASSPHRRIAAEFAPETGGLAATRNVLVMARTSDGRACDLPAELARAMMDRGIAIGANDGINH